ncbi:MAG: AAA family ATPase [Ktedonobacteraceae bacterium]
MGRRDNYSPDVRLVISYAREEARRLRHRQISPEHLFLGILKLQHPLIEGLFASLHVSTVGVSQALSFVVGRGNKAILSEPALNTAARSALARAEDLVAGKDLDLIDLVNLVGPDHLFLALLEEQNSVVLGVLESFGIQTSHARKQLTMLLNGGYERMQLSTAYYKGYESTPLLNQVSRDLTLAALNNLLDPLIGRQAELERMMQILLRRTKNNPVLIGPAGVGKTAIAEGLAIRIIHGQVPENLLHRRVVALDVSMLSIGTRLRGDLEERLKLILQEMCGNPGIIVVIDELQLLVQTGAAEGSLALADIFKPMLSRGEFQCIGATTADEYRQCIEADAALERRFQPIFVSAMTSEQTLQVLEGVRRRYEMFHRLTISDDALEAAVKMSLRYIQGRALPDKALDLLDEAAARVSVRRAMYPNSVQRLRDALVAAQREKETSICRGEFSRAAHLFVCERALRHELWLAQQVWQLDKQQRAVLDGQDIAEVVAMWTGIPVVQIAGEERFRLLRLEHELHRRVIGQQEAVRAVARAVRRARANISNSHRPIGSFMFVGPSGVGKTEVARALAAALFGDESALLRFDMSEFMESPQVARLIGAPPGYVGYEQAGQLTEAVRRRPYCVMLFDEVEKAHPKVLDLLLQILEDGCLTDARGETVDFKHTLIILTSNVGTSHTISGPMTFTARPRRAQQGDGREMQEVKIYEQMRQKVLADLKDVFRPELLNRIDDVVVFHPLALEHLYAIVDLLIAQAERRMAMLGFELRVTQGARMHLITHGYDANYGARPLRRTVQSQIEDLLAEEILRGHFSRGDRVTVYLRDAKLALQVQVGNTENTESAVAVKADQPGHAAA